MSKIIIIDDEESIRSTLKDILEYEEYEVHTADGGLEGWEMIQENNGTYDVAIVDLKMPELDGIELLERIRRVYPSISVIMISGHSSTDNVVEAMKKGAFDYIQKPPDLNKLLITTRNGVEKKELIQSAQTIYKVPPPSFIGATPAANEVRALIALAAKGDMQFVPALIYGDTGVGKEIVARLIHEESERANFPFVAMNCGSVPNELIESEFFGHERGSFTGAHRQRAGYFEQTNGGTLFLDEIGNAPMTLQTKLLRVLQDGKFRRVGGERDIQSNVRIISGTNEDLAQMVKDSKFRSDLYYRLKGMPIKIPPLKKRKDDLPLLIKHFFENLYPGKIKLPLSEGALGKVTEYSWPGNVRELFSTLMLANALALAENKEAISEEHIRI